MAVSGHQVPGEWWRCVVRRQEALLAVAPKPLNLQPVCKVAKVLSRKHLDCC